LGVDSYALLPGGELNSDKVLSREFQIIGKFIAESEADLLEKKRALESAFYTNDNQLTRLRFNGSKVQKELAVRYQSGLEGDLATFYGNVEIVEDERYTEHELYTEKAAIQVVAPYPYWQEVGESAVLLDTNDSATFRLVAGRLRSTGQWDELGPPNAAGTYTAVYTLAEDDIYLYIGGNFLNFDNIAAADYVVRYDKRAGTYSALDVGLNGVVWDMALAPNGDLYIGGEFTNAGGIAAADYLTRWDGTNFNAVGTPVSGGAVITRVQALAFDRAGILYVGGLFTNWNNIAAADYIVKWDGSSYTALSTGMDGYVKTIVVGPDNAVYMGGGFLTAGGVSASYATYWANSAFHSMSTSGINGQVETMAIAPNGILYVGGFFTTILGSTVFNHIASWNGLSWSTLGDGLNADVYNLFVGNDGFLYISGSFTSAGDITLADRIARWNGYAWVHLDIDLPGAAIAYSILASKYVDPVIPQKYDLFVGFDTTGTGTFAGLVTPTNGGNVAAYPKVIVKRTGGTSGILETIKNESTGLELLFNYGLLDGETLEINLTPGNRSIISSFFGPRPDAILANSDFGQWSLQPGMNDVSSFVAVAGGPTIEASMIWRESYSGY
jgi:hypothetical protein